MTLTERDSTERAGPGEQTRARYPDEQGYIERDRVRVSYEVYGHGEPTILFLPTWTFVHSRIWKMQIRYFARHHRVVVFDPRGNGQSDRPEELAAYAEAEFAQDALDVMDATATERAVIVGLSRGARRCHSTDVLHHLRGSGLVSHTRAIRQPGASAPGLPGRRALCGPAEKSGIEGCPEGRFGPGVRE